MSNQETFHQLQFGSLTDVGMVRKENQDSNGKFPDHLALSEEQVFVVADGMGGHADGRLASDTAVRVTLDTFTRDKQGSIPQRLRRALEAANKAINDMVQQMAGGEIMGTTCTVLVLQNTQVFVGHIGDSRMYRINGQNVEQVTRDHTMVNEMVAQGVLNADEAAHHPQRNMLSRALGPDKKSRPEGYEIDRIKSNDIFVLCSDGLGEVTKEEIRDIVLDFNPQEAAKKLVKMANDRGGMDNVTVQVVKVVPRGTSVEEVVTPVHPVPQKEPVLLNSNKPLFSSSETIEQDVFESNEEPLLQKTQEKQKTVVTKSEPTTANQPKSSEKKSKLLWLIPLGILLLLVAVFAIWKSFATLDATTTSTIPPEQWGIENSGTVNEQTAQTNRTGRSTQTPTTSNQPRTNPTPLVEPSSGQRSTPSVSNPPQTQVQENTSTTVSPEQGVDINLLLSEARQLLDKGQLEQAGTQYKSILQENPSNASAKQGLRNISDKYLALGDKARIDSRNYSLALNYYQKAQSYNNSTQVQRRISETQKLLDSNQE